VSPLGGDFSLHGFNFFGKPITISTTFVIQMYSALLSQLILTRKLLVFGCQSHKKLLDINLTKNLQKCYVIWISLVTWYQSHQKVIWYQSHKKVARTLLNTNLARNLLDFHYQYNICNFVQMLYKCWFYHFKSYNKVTILDITKNLLNINLTRKLFDMGG